MTSLRVIDLSDPALRERLLAAVYAEITGGRPFREATEGDRKILDDEVESMYVVLRTCGYGVSEDDATAGEPKRALAYLWSTLQALGADSPDAREAYVAVGEALNQAHDGRAGS